jgi:dihydroorotate dehydrogenase (fumarate)
VLIDGLVNWMEEKGFATLDVVRGQLAVPAEADGADYERAGYVTALRAANMAEYGPW